MMQGHFQMTEHPQTKESEFVRLCINDKSNTDENKLQKYLKQLGAFVRCAAIMTRCIFQNACLIPIRIILIIYVFHVCIVKNRSCTANGYF